MSDGTDFQLRRAMKSLEKLQQATGGGSYAAESRQRDEVQEKMATLQGYKLAEYKVLLEVKLIRDTLHDVEELEAKSSGANPGKKASLVQDIGRKKQKIRKSVEALKGLTRDAQREANREKGNEGDVKELLYHAENAKKLFRQKFSSRSSDVGDDGASSESSMGNFGAKGYGATSSPVVNNIQDFSDTGGGGGTSLRDDDEFAQFFQTVEARNQKFDQQLDRVHQGVLRLGENAKVLTEELNMQSHLLDTTEEKVDKATTRILGLNRSLKKAIQAVDNDKMFMYVCCAFILLGLGGGILYASGALKK